MSDWGLTLAGFKPKTMDAIKKEMESELRNAVDPNLRFSSDTIAGQLTGIIANQARQVWEAFGGLYHSLQPDCAGGRALDSLCYLTGTYRKRARFCRATAAMMLDGNATLPKDSRIRSVNGDFFKTTVEVKNESGERAEIEVDLVAEELGTLAVPPGATAEIMTPSAGWIAAKIKGVLQQGRLEETDEDLRLRRMGELKAKGSSTADALRASFKELEGVQALHIKEQPDRFEVIISGGKDEEIAQTIWRSKPLGIETVGNTACLIADSIAQMRTVRFSRPAIISLKLRAELKVRSHLDETELDRLKGSLVAHAEQHFRLGAEVYASRFFPALLDNAKVLDVINLHLCDRTTGKKAPTQINEDQIAALAFDDITIEQIIEEA